MAVYTVPNPQSLLGLDADLKTAIKGYEQIIVATERNIQDYLPMFFKDKTFSAKKITEGVFSGFGQGAYWDMKSEKPVVNSSRLWEITCEQYSYASSFPITFEQQKYDEMFQLNAKNAADFSASLAHTKQIVGSSFWNNAWATTSACQWYNVEGKAFFSETHRYAPGSAVSGTWSNFGTGALSQTNILLACNQIFDQRDMLGRPMNLRPDTLYVYPTKIAEAREFLGQGMDLKSGEVSNNRNPFQNEFAGIKVVGYPYFDASTTWILAANKTQTYMSQKFPLTISTVRPQTTAGTIMIDGYFSFAAYAESPIGYVGYKA